MKLGVPRGAPEVNLVPKVNFGVPRSVLEMKFGVPRCALEVKFDRIR